MSAPKERCRRPRMKDKAGSGYSGKASGGAERKANHDDTCLNSVGSPSVSAAEWPTWPKQRRNKSLPYFWSMAVSSWRLKKAEERGKLQHFPILVRRR